MYDVAAVCVLKMP